MKRVMVRYRVKTDRAAENERYIAAVFEQLKREQPPGLHYASFKLDDGVSFVHIASYEDGGAGSPLLALSAFKAFVAAIRDRCEEPPATTALNEIGAYRFFDT
jgi:quinol monooxygenase YgiN